MINIWSKISESYKKIVIIFEHDNQQGLFAFSIALYAPFSFCAALLSR